MRLRPRRWRRLTDWYREVRRDLARSVWRNAPPRRKVATQRSIHVERLEERRLLTVDWTLVNGLHITGDYQDDTITVSTEAIQLDEFGADGEAVLLNGEFLHDQSGGYIFTW